tara:strand:+ start:2635 stop:3438 length:804 start_codon:yes stop_codon:yes gene_type:complete
MFINEKENKIGKEFIDKGYIIFDIENEQSFNHILSHFDEDLIRHNFPKENIIKNLNNTHNFIPIDDLNNFRLNIINSIKENKNFRLNYYNLAKKHLDIIVGNELVMQQRINLSIQLPNDTSSLLPIHADVWSGDSPFEVVLWVPLVDCYGTKTMYLLPPEYQHEVHEKFNDFANTSPEEIFELFKKKVIWLEVKRGQCLIFNQSLPHGNIVNVESETRWSMNCRFKSLFSPYGDKKLGEFFEPISIKPATQIGFDYKMPQLNLNEKN